MRHATTSPTLRIGIPHCAGKLMIGARTRNYPVLLSANAFATYHPKGHRSAGFFRKFRLPDPGLYRGVDAALDSAGFVAAAHYGRYPWSVTEYFDLVCAHPWAWYAAMDYCCEPQIAADRPMRLLRIAATAWSYHECAREAQHRAVKPPTPVLQGWTPDEYVQCVRWMGLDAWPDLVGIGSVCRRSLHGPDGLLPIVAALDEALPEHVRFHLFGVKSQALTALADDPRIASADSMAWDAAARRARPTGRDAAFRLEHMHAWHDRQREGLASNKPPVQNVLHLPQAGASLSSDTAIALEALAWLYAEQVAGGTMAYHQALRWSRTDAFAVEAIVAGGALSDDVLCQLDEDVFSGLGERIEQMASLAGWRCRPQPSPSQAATANRG